MHGHAAGRHGIGVAEAVADNGLPGAAKGAPHLRRCVRFEGDCSVERAAKLGEVGDSRRYVSGRCGADLGPAIVVASEAAPDLRSACRVRHTRVDLAAVDGQGGDCHVVGIAEAGDVDGRPRRAVQATPQLAGVAASSASIESPIESREVENGRRRDIVGITEPRLRDGRPRIAVCRTEDLRAVRIDAHVQRVVRSCIQVSVELLERTYFGGIRNIKTTGIDLLPIRGHRRSHLLTCRC